MTVDARQAAAARFNPLAVTVPRDRPVSFAQGMLAGDALVDII